MTGQITDICIFYSRLLPNLAAYHALNQLNLASPNLGPDLAGEITGQLRIQAINGTRSTALPHTGQALGRAKLGT